VVVEIADEAGAAAWLAFDVRRVRLPRRPRRNHFARACNLGFGRPPDVEIIYLRVARELVEVERLQRLEPGAVVHVRRDCWCGLRSATSGLTSAASLSTAASSPATGSARVEPRDDVAHLVLDEAEDFLKVRHGRVLRWCGWRDWRNACWSSGALRSGSRDLVAKNRRVLLQRGVELLVRHAHPPREHRIVAVVEIEPLSGGRTELRRRIGRAAGDDFGQLRRGGRVALESGAQVLDGPDHSYRG